MSANRINFDGTKNMSFLIKNDEILEKFNEILGKLSNSIKNEFNSDPAYNKKYLKTENIKEYRCLKIVIHQIDGSVWLVLSAFQEGLRQNLSLSFS